MWKIAGLLIAFAATLFAGGRQNTISDIDISYTSSHVMAGSLCPGGHHRLVVLLGEHLAQLFRKVTMLASGLFFIVVVSFVAKGS